MLAVFELFEREKKTYFFLISYPLMPYVIAPASMWHLLHVKFVNVDIRA